MLKKENFIISDGMESPIENGIRKEKKQFEIFT
jgi:hypothetical protein